MYLITDHWHWQKTVTRVLKTKLRTLILLVSNIGNLSSIVLQICTKQNEVEKKIIRKIRNDVNPFIKLRFSQDCLEVWPLRKYELTNRRNYVASPGERD